MFFVRTLILLCCASQYKLTTNKEARAEFTRWGYGQGIIAQGLLEMTRENMDGLDYSPWVNDVYSTFLEKDGNAFALANNLTADIHSIPRWSKAIVVYKVILQVIQSHTSGY